MLCLSAVAVCSRQQPFSQAAAAAVQSGVPAHLMPWKTQNIPSLAALKQRMLLHNERLC